MSESTLQVRALNDEAALWAALKTALAHKGAGMPFAVDFSQSDWAKVQVKYTGEKFHSSLTPSAMQGLVLLQASLYRSAAAILKGPADTRHLTNLERSELELTFIVSDGSADTEGAGKDFLSTLSGAIMKMDSNHKLIAVLALGLAFFTSQGYKNYLDETGKHETETIQAGTLRAVLAHDEENQRLLAEAYKSSRNAAEIGEQSALAFEHVVKHSGDVSSLTVQGVTLDKESIDKLKSTTRRVAENITFNEQFKIKNVDPSSPDGFQIEIESSASGRIFKATMYDSLSSEAMRKTIRNAEWNRRPVTLTVTARILGDDVVDARILKASNPKPKKLQIVDRVIRSRSS